MDLTIINDHVARAVGRLIHQYKNKTVITAIIESTVTPLQGLEEVLFDLRDNRGIDTATGVQLDLLGIIIGIQRVPGQDDDAYRISLKTKIIQNVSFGDAESAIAIFKNLTMAELVQLGENFPGGVSFGGDVSLGDEAFVNKLYIQCDFVLPAGARVDSLIEFDDTEPFAVSGDIFGSGLGDDLDPLVGGKLATFRFNYNYEFALGDADPLKNDLTGRGLGNTKDPLVGGFLIP